MKSQLLSVLADQYLASGDFDAALQTFQAIPSPQERRIALLVADFARLPIEKIEALVQILESDPVTHALTSRLALSMLESNNVTAAWQILDASGNVFESDQQRYDFLEKVLPLTNQENEQKVFRLFDTFGAGIDRDWAALAIAKYLATQQHGEDAEKYIAFLSLPLRQSWAYDEISKIVPSEHSTLYFHQAIQTLESATVADAAKEIPEEMKESFAVQFRLLGCEALRRGDHVQGVRLLERSESAAATLAVPMQRFRLQIFLGKVLIDIHQIAAIQEYIAIDDMLDMLPSPLDRSKVLVWLAEAGWEEGWSKAAEVLAFPKRGISERERADQNGFILKRFAAHQQGLKSVGEPAEDAVRISGEEFESLYYNPFAAPDCNCY